MKYFFSGCRNGFSDLEIADYLIDNVENAEQVHIKEGGHLSIMEKPGEFNKAILDFLAQYK